MVKFRKGSSTEVGRGENDSPSRDSIGGNSMDEVDLGWGGGLGTFSRDGPLGKGFGSFDGQAEASARGECEGEIFIGLLCLFWIKCLKEK